MEMDRFRQSYQNREKYMAYCRECPRYETVWSCPPLAFDVDAYLAPYGLIYPVCARIDLDEATIAAADTAEKIKSTGWGILLAVKLDMEEKLRRLEPEAPGSVSLSSGGCNLCAACTRRDGKPCRRPDRMRYSLDAFGFDLTAITKDLFSIDIQWCSDRLPDHFTLVHALLAKEEVPEASWQKVGFSFTADA